MDKFFTVFQITAFEPVAVISRIYSENTCDLQSTFYQTILRFQFSLRNIFYKSSCARLMENMEKSAAVQVLAVFWTRNMFTVQRCPKTEAYEHWSNHISRGQYLSKCLRYEADIFFQKWAKSCVDSKYVIKIAESVLPFWDNSVSVLCHNFSHLWRQYMWSAVNLLRNSPKIMDLTKIDIFLLYLL